MAHHSILILLFFTKVQSFVSGRVKPISDNDIVVPKISDSLTLCCQSNESHEHCDWWNGPQKQNLVVCNIDSNSKTNISHSPKKAFLNSVQIDANFEQNKCTIRLSNFSSPSNGSGWDCRLSWNGKNRRKDRIKRTTKLEVITTRMPSFINGSTFHTKVVDNNTTEGGVGSLHLDTGKMSTYCTAL